ncbi:Hypothetical predicted protein [Mytilus galloprovincialis]|uniref:Uncharacterized protein n=1 Tax=Mytilus galloprovincialis TaxID=29158 RepID=A0A8B6G4P6_MYTGA|nr:Hypothetical predicted protein [Mytilus galloprovincialis]
MFDGKKVRKGGDVNLLGFEDGQSLHDRKEIHANEIKAISKLVELIRNINRIDPFVKNTQLHERQNVFDLLKKCFEIISSNIRELREFKKRKDGMLRRLKDLASKNVTKMSSYVYVTVFCRTVLYKVDNCLSTLLEVQWIICKTGSVLNNAEHLFAEGNIVNVKLQRNVRFLQSSDEIKERLNLTFVPTHLTKQHSQEWIDSRRKAKVTGSTIYAAIGCDSLKNQKKSISTKLPVVLKQTNLAKNNKMQFVTGPNPKYTKLLLFLA